MFDYETLRVIWWLLLGVLLIGFAIMMASIWALAPPFASRPHRCGAPRAARSIEPVWEGNQVWFILGGGAVFAAWPLLYAASFSGLYLAMFLLLLAFILRPVGFSYRNKLDRCALAQCVGLGPDDGGAVPALLFGVAFGNLFLGLPFHFDALQRPVYTGGFFDLLHPFALLAGVVSLSMLDHARQRLCGAEGGEPMATRAAPFGRVASVIFVLAFVAGGFWVGSNGRLRDCRQHRSLRPLESMQKRCRRRRRLARELSHVALDVGGAGWRGAGGRVCESLLCELRRAGAAVHGERSGAGRHDSDRRVCLVSVPHAVLDLPDQSLTVWDASSSAKTLLIMLGAAVVFLPIVLRTLLGCFGFSRDALLSKRCTDHEGPY